MLWQADEPLHLPETLLNATTAAYWKLQAVTGVFCTVSSLYVGQFVNKPGKSLSLPSPVSIHCFSSRVSVTSGKAV